MESKGITGNPIGAKLLSLSPPYDDAAYVAGLGGCGLNDEGKTNAGDLCRRLIGLLFRH